MSEKMPMGERPEPIVVGSASPERKKAAQQDLMDKFGEAHYEQLSEEAIKILEANEKEKDPYEIEAIKGANKITNEFLAEFGLTEFDIPEKNVHIIPPNLFRELESKPTTVALALLEKQAIALDGNATRQPFMKLSTILHEMTHLKGFLSLEVPEGESERFRRTGFTVHASLGRGQSFEAFRGMEEGVVAEIEKRYTPRLVRENPYLKGERERQMSEEAVKLKQEIATKEGLDISEIFLVNEDAKSYATFPYKPQRKVLNYIVDALYENNEDQFESRDEAMKLFFKAHFTGNIVPVARLIEQSFGKGSFRTIGMMDTNKNSAAMVMDYLIKHKKRGK